MNEDEELEKQIRLQKKLLSDYNKLREAYYIDDKTYDGADYKLKVVKDDYYISLKKCSYHQ